MILNLNSKNILYLSIFKMKIRFLLFYHILLLTLLLPINSLKIHHQNKINIYNLHDISSLNHLDNQENTAPEVFNAVPYNNNQDINDPLVQFGLWIAFDPVLYEYS